MCSKLGNWFAVSFNYSVVDTVMNKHIDSVNKWSDIFIIFLFFLKFFFS